MSAYLPPGWPFLWDRCFVIFKNSQMIYAGYVNIATGKSQTGRVKRDISASAREVKFSLGKGKNPPGWVSLGLLRRHETINSIAYATCTQLCIVMQLYTLL